MIKRSKRNIGKVVRVIPHHTKMDNRLGKVMGFRGDRAKGDPFVNVFIYDLADKRRGSIYPIPGSQLEAAK